MKKFIQDCKHMLWLLKQIIILGLKGDWEGSYEAWLFMKIHWNYESRKIN